MIVYCKRNNFFGGFLTNHIFRKSIINFFRSKLIYNFMKIYFSRNISINLRIPLFTSIFTSENIHCGTYTTFTEKHSFCVTNKISTFTKVFTAKETIGHYYSPVIYFCTVFILCCRFYRNLCNN